MPSLPQRTRMDYKICFLGSLAVLRTPSAHYGVACAISRNGRLDAARSCTNFPKSVYFASVMTSSSDRVPSANPLTRQLRVLSIQSHVVSGYVGNKAACFPLQLLGFEVDVINSCMLSNHTGYKNGALGPKTTTEDMSAIFRGLDANRLLSPVTHLLTGYAASTDVLESIVSAHSMLQETRPDSTGSIVYVCDPVLGDDGCLYVSEGLIPIYRDRILPLATVLTPNCFELSLLAEVGPVMNEPQALAACRKLHDKFRIPIIVVTGVQFSERPSTISMLVSENSGDCYALDAERFSCNFTGSGDLTAALVLAWLELCPDNYRCALQSAMASVSAILARTLMMSDVKNDCCPCPELKLIQCLEQIQNPPTGFVRIRDIQQPK